MVQLPEIDVVISLLHFVFLVYNCIKLKLRQEIRHKVHHLVLFREDVEERLVHDVGSEQTWVYLANTKTVIEMSLDVENFVQIPLAVEPKTVNEVFGAFTGL